MWTLSSPSWFSCLILQLAAFSSVDKVYASHQTELCRDSNGTATEVYNVDTHVCCGGILIKKRWDVSFECCEGEMYESNTGECCSDRWLLKTEQTCCRGIPRDLQEGMTCCGNPAYSETWMNTRTHTCCFDQEVNTFEARDGRGQCCGNDKVYQQESQMCCATGGGSNVHDITHEELVSNQLACCGLQVMNVSIEQCCKFRNDASVEPRSDYIRCCGTSSYDIRTQVCCGGVPQPVQDGKTECCDQTSFNIDTETCCDEVIFPIGNGSCCGEQAYSPTLASCCKLPTSLTFHLNTSVPTIPGLHACCGLDSYLRNQQVCCDGHLHDSAPGKACCGTELYDTQTQMCCSNTEIVTKHSETTMCCGRGTYESNTQTCCAGQAANITDGGCCQTEPYDPKTHTCCQYRPRSKGQIYPGAGQKHNCCGHKLFNQEIEICTGYRNGVEVISKPADHLDHDSVCYAGRPSSYTTFNSKTMMCVSDGSLMPIQPGELLCGGALYHPDSNICCMGARYDRFTHNGDERHCCGSSTRPFNPVTQTCVTNKVIDIPQNQASMCGSRDAYNSDTHFCYKNLVVRRKEDYRLVPCGSLYRPNSWYDPTQFKCDQDMGIILASDETLCNGVSFYTPGVGLGFGQCCAGVAYNPYTQFCCGSQVHNITEGLSCCGGVIHNQHNPDEICCKNRLRSTEDGRTLCTGSIAHRPDQGVCGVYVYSKQTQMCCDNTLYPRSSNLGCCGKLAFNTAHESKLCCANTLHYNAISKECCGSQTIEPSNTTCYYLKGEAFAFPGNLAQTTLCTEGNYDPSLHTCCDGILHGVPQGQCCGPDLIRDPSKEICCGGLVKEKGSSTICCNGVTYDGNWYVCCGDKANNVLSISEACCNNTAYNKYEDDCDNGVLSSKKSLLPSTTPSSQPTTPGYPPNTKPLCDGTPYDNRTSGCCSGKVYNIFSQKCDNSSVLRNKCQVCRGNNSRKQNSQKVCTSKLILLIKITAREINGANGMMTLAAADIAIIKDDLDLLQDDIKTLTVKAPKACHCNRATNTQDNRDYLIMTDSRIAVENTLWLQPGDTLARSTDTDLGNMVRRMLRQCNRWDRSS